MKRRLVVLVIVLVFLLAVPAFAEEKDKEDKEHKWKDTSPKLSGNSFVFDKDIVESIVVKDADDQKQVLKATINGNQLDLPFDASQPGKIAIRIEAGNLVYIIRRNA